MAESLIKMYTDILRRHIDSPQTFIEASAYSIIASTLGRQYSYLHPDTVYPFRPNVFFMMSCIPGRGRRSSVLNNWKHSYEKILEGYYEKRAFKINRPVQEIIDATLYTGGSCAGVVDHITDAISEYEIKEFVNFNTEYGSSIKLMAPGKYSEGLGFLKCMLYYGESWSEDLSKRGKKKDEDKQRRRIPQGLYVNSITGMQEIEKILHSGISDNGLLRREMIVYEPEFSMDSWKPPLPPIGEAPKTILEELNSFSVLVADKMVQNEMLLKEHGKDKISVYLHPRVLDIINQVARVDDSKISKRGRENIDIIRQTRWEHLLKLSMLEAIARSDIRITRTFGTDLSIDILPEDETKAFKFLEEIHKRDPDISNALEERKTYRSRTIPMDDVHEFIASSPQGKTTTEVYNRFHKKYDDLDDILAKLRQAGRIELKSERRSVTGPETKFYQEVV